MQAFFLKKRIILLLFLFLFTAACAADITNDQTLSDVEEGDLRIAAVGDSITDSYMSGTGYPEQLDDMLGDGYAVMNFGESNYAAQASSDFPYTETDSYEESLSFDPDIVILMLGTNDTKAPNWNGADTFKEEYTDLVESYLELGGVSRVILASPPTVFLENAPKGSIDPENIGSVRDAVEEVAEEYELEFVDMTAETRNHPQWFFDGVHPTQEGAEQLAEIFYEQLNE